MSILNLSPELLLLVATQLRQVDLLNVSLVCKQLHFVTEPELYREYSNPRNHTRSFLPFIRKLIERPELTKHVRLVDLHAWDMLDIFSPDLNNEMTLADIEDMRKNELGPGDYHAMTRAAKLAGVVSTIYPYESSSRLIDIAESFYSGGGRRNEFNPWYEHYFDDELCCAKLSYDRKFCQLLRAGIEDAQAVLLLALLPNLQEIFLRGGPHDVNTLDWRASHKFAALRRLSVRGADGELTWPLSFFNSVLDTTPKLEILRVCIASSWTGQFDDIFQEMAEAPPLRLRPRSLGQVTSLVLQQSCVKSSDLRNLLQACAGLRSFCYYHGNDGQGPYSPSPAEMLVLLEPFKDTLERLTLGLDLFEVEHLDVEARFGSFAHMKALQFLDTSAEMWKDLEDEDLYDPYVEDEVPNDSTRLSSRLPSSLHTLIFHSSGEQIEPSLMQIRDVLLMRPHVLPNLQELYVATENEEYTEDLSDILADMKPFIETGPQPLNIEVGSGSFMTVFDTVLLSHYLPDTKWFGKKYSARYRKPNDVDRALERIGQAYEEVRMANDSYDSADAVANEPELAAVMGPLECVNESPLYYDSDEKGAERDWC